MAKVGKGNGAVANAIGSQVLSIQFGIGFPALLFNLIGGHSLKMPPGHVIVLGLGLAFLVAVFMCALDWKQRGQGHVVLSRRGAITLLCCYGAVMVTSIGMHYYRKGAYIEHHDSSDV